MWGTIIGAITGINPSKIVTDITGYLSARVNAAKDAEIASIQSGQAVSIKEEETIGMLATLQQAIILADQQWWVTRWIRPGFAYIAMFHFGMVALASIGWVKGPINALPYPMDYLEAGIIGSYFLLRPFEKRRIVGGPTKGT